MRRRLQRHIEEAVQWVLEPGEELVGVAALAQYDRESTYHDFGPFGAKKVVVLTTSRVLLVNYFGVVDCHVERVAECPRADASLSQVKIGGIIRLLRLDLRTREEPTSYRVYFRFGKQADELVRILDSQRLTPFVVSPAALPRHSPKRQSALFGLVPPEHWGERTVRKEGPFGPRKWPGRTIEIGSPLWYH